MLRWAIDLNMIGKIIKPLERNKETYHGLGKITSIRPPKYIKLSKKRKEIY